MSRFIITLSTLIMLMSWVHSNKTNNGVVTATGKLARRLDATSNSGRPTLTAHEPFDPYEDAARLYWAMKGAATDEKTLINILAYRTFEQRKAIAESFEKQYSDDLVSWLTDETSGWFRTTLVYMVKGPDRMLSTQILHAIWGAGTDEQALISILVPRTANELRGLRRDFKESNELHGELQTAIMDDTSGNFQHWLRNLVYADRSESEAVDNELADKEALLLFGKEKFEILAFRSWAQLKATFLSHERQFGKSFSQTLLEGFLQAPFGYDYDSLSTIFAIERFARDSSGFFANEIKVASSGAGTDEAALIRVILGRAEIDLASINDACERLFQTSIAYYVEGETSGYFRDTLLALMGIRGAEL